MNTNELEKKKAEKKKAIKEALLETVRGGAFVRPGPVNFICTFDPNPNIAPIPGKL